MAEIALTWQEKCYLIALYGDIPEGRREGLFRVSHYPPQAGPEVWHAGHQFIRDQLARGTRPAPTLRRRKRHPLLEPQTWPSEA